MKKGYNSENTLQYLGPKQELKMNQFMTIKDTDHVFLLTLFRFGFIIKKRIYKRNKVIEPPCDVNARYEKELDTVCSLHDL